MLCRAAACALFLIGTSGTVSADCRDAWICVDTINDGGNIELRARNLREYPVTYTLSVRTRSLDVAGPKTITRTLQGRQSQSAFRLSRSQGNPEGSYRYYLDWTVGDRNAVHDDDHLYVLPYGPGKAYRVIQGYGSRFSHTGLEEFAIDFDMPVGTPVHAARAGIVVRVEQSNDVGCWRDGCGRYANYVVILHEDGTTGEYYHLKQNGSLVDVSDRVERGQHIAYSGNTGHTTMPHLHFAVYRAADWGNTQSIPVRFVTADGIIDRPRRGARYPAM